MENKGDSLYISSHLCIKEPSKLRLKNTQKNIMCDNETKRKKLSTWPLSSYCYNKFSVLSYKDKDEEDEIVSIVYISKKRTKGRRQERLEKQPKNCFRRSNFKRALKTIIQILIDAVDVSLVIFQTKNSVGGLLEIIQILLIQVV